MLKLNVDKFLGTDAILSVEASLGEEATSRISKIMRQTFQGELEEIWTVFSSALPTPLFLASSSGCLKYDSALALFC